MAHHAYFVAGSVDEGVATALSFVERELGLPPAGNPDVSVHRYDHFSVDHARALIGFESQAPVSGDRKAIIVATSRLFHEAQNAMLKLFEEPSPGTTLILVVPSAGVLLPTLRSRLLPLAQEAGEGRESFLTLTAQERRKRVDALYQRSKSDKDEEKQAARREALELVQSITREAYERGGDPALLKELSVFTRVLHERSASLKLLFEHLLLVLPGPGRSPQKAV